MFAHHPFYSKEPSWPQFHGSFAAHVSRFRGDTVGPVSFAGEETALAYFNSSAGNLKVKKPTSTKNKTTLTHTDMLVRLPNMILENVTVDVYDFSLHDEGERGMYFTADAAAKGLACMDVDTENKFDVILGRLPAENDFPECGVRLPQSELIYLHNEEQRTFRAENDGTQEEAEILNYDHLPVFPMSSTQSLPLLARSLPKDRISPFRVAFVINLLKRNQKLGNPLHETIPDPQLVQECADHLQAYLKITPGRSVAFGAVTNLRQCFFVAVCVDEGGPYHRRAYLPFNSSLITGSKNVARELARFRATDPLALGLNPALFHSPHLKEDSLLGRGRKSVVMEGRWQGDRIALKV